MSTIQPTTNSITTTRLPPYLGDDQLDKTLEDAFQNTDSTTTTPAHDDEKKKTATALMELATSTNKSNPTPAQNMLQKEERKKPTENIISGLNGQMLKIISDKWNVADVNCFQELTRRFASMNTDNYPLIWELTAPLYQLFIKRLIQEEKVVVVHVPLWIKDEISQQLK